MKFKATKFEAVLKNANGETLELKCPCGNESAAIIIGLNIECSYCYECLFKTKPRTHEENE